MTKLDGALLQASRRRPGSSRPPLLPNQLRARATCASTSSTTAFRLIVDRARAARGRQLAARQTRRKGAAAADPRWGSRAKIRPAARRVVAAREGLRAVRRQHSADARDQGALRRPHRHRRLRRAIANQRKRLLPALCRFAKVRLRRARSAPSARQERPQRRARELGSRDRRRASAARLSPRARCRDAEPRAYDRRRETPADATRSSTFCSSTSDLYPPFRPAAKAVFAEGLAAARPPHRLGHAGRGALDPLRRAAVQRRHGARRTHARRRRRLGRCAAPPRRRAQRLQGIRPAAAPSLFARADQGQVPGRAGRHRRRQAPRRAGLLLARLPARRSVTVRRTQRRRALRLVVSDARRAAALVAVSRDHAVLLARVRAERADAARRRAAKAFRSRP